MTISGPSNGPSNNYIQHASYANQANSAATNIRAKNSRQPEETKTDIIDLSGKTRDLQKISQAMEIAPADRQQKISHIKQQVSANQYTVDALQVAEKMVGAILNEPA
ncbi:MAG: flagellar biosynthesis anti-sigma factor FlgM [Desulfotignum sp.]|jgi:flagellar biosynthesis anti-sigma factor FlgM|nr:flagellar biosynthesis anti-sigma factor FlgM [Desulfotignum sp.]